MSKVINPNHETYYNIWRILPCKKSIISSFTDPVGNLLLAENDPCLIQSGSDISRLQYWGKKHCCNLHQLAVLTFNVKCRFTKPSSNEAPTISPEVSLSSKAVSQLSWMKAQL